MQKNAETPCPDTTSVFKSESHQRRPPARPPIIIIVRSKRIVQENDKDIWAPNQDRIASTNSSLIPLSSVASSLVSFTRSSTFSTFSRSSLGRQCRTS